MFQRRDMVRLQALPVNGDAVQRSGDNLRRRLLTEIALFQAEARVIQQIFMAGAAFRILAPAAAQRATFKKDNGANAGTIMRRITLDIKNHKPSPFLRSKI